MGDGVHERDVIMSRKKKKRPRIILHKEDGDGSPCLCGRYVNNHANNTNRSKKQKHAFWYDINTYLTPLEKRFRLCSLCKHRAKTLLVMEVMKNHGGVS